MDKFKKLTIEINQYLDKVRENSCKEPTGILKYKFLDPGAGYSNVLWDWDSYFCAVSFAGKSVRAAEHLKGCVLNFVSYIREDGSIPFCIPSGKEDICLTKKRDDKSPNNSIKPFLAQMSIYSSSALNDYSWIKDIYHDLVNYIKHWERTQRTNWNLFVWRSHRGCGTDNHPAVYGRPYNSSAGVDLNCFMYREYRAMHHISEIMKDDKASKEYFEKAELLKEAINKYMWDPIDKIYYNLDMSSEQPDNTNQKITWSIPLKFKVWTGFVPMWAKIALEKHVDEMVKLHLMNKEEFWSDYGIRSLAKNEPAYNIFSGGNPSNWQGPIWVISNYLVFRGLMNYRYKKEAQRLAENLLGVLVRDLQVNNALSEYYNPETGEGMCNLGFLNWNMLAGVMYEEFNQNKDLTETEKFKL